MRVAVVGAGVCGVGSALAILQKVPEADVTIIAERQTPDTTGDGAAGIWGPHLVHGDPHKIASWARQTHDLLEHLWREGDCPGIGLVAGLDLMEPEIAPWESAPFYCAPLPQPSAGHLATPETSILSAATTATSIKTAAESATSAGKQVKPEGREPSTASSANETPDSPKVSQDEVPYSGELSENKKSTTKTSEKETKPRGNALPRLTLSADKGRLCRIVTFYTEPSKLLPYLMERYRELGGKTTTGKVTSLTDLTPDYDVIVNCTGLGAYDLVGDKTMSPIRGQILRVCAPHFKHFIGIHDTYIVPNDEVIILGGTAQHGDWRRENDPSDSAQILDRCCHLVPSLKTTPIEPIKPWAGLRPFRTAGVRLETENRVFGARIVTVIHNYGHGGAGVTLFWGCALEIAEIVGKCAANSGDLAFANRSKL